MGACQVLREGPKPYAIDCVLAYLDSWGLAEVLLKADHEPAIQALVDGVRAKRGERTMVEISPKYSHQSNGAAEKAVRRIESLTRTCVCVLQKKLGYKVDSKSIVLPWLMRHAAYVLSRFVKRDDGHSAGARLRGKECDSPLAPIGDTVDFKFVRGDMAKLEPRWAVGIFLGRARVMMLSSEQLQGSSLRTKDKQWERDAFTTFIGVPWNPRGPDGKQQTTIHHKVPHPAAWRDARLFSVLGNRFAKHSEVSREVREADQPERHRRDSRSANHHGGWIRSPPAAQRWQSNSNIRPSLAWEEFSAIVSEGRSHATSRFVSDPAAA